MKTKVIVEGKSDSIFLKNLFKYLNINNIYVEISGGKNKQEITSVKTLKRIIENAIEDGFDKVIIMIDRIMKFDTIPFSCVIDVKAEYQKRVLSKIRAGIDIDVVVVDEEIECWFILAKENINSYTRRCYSQAKELFSADTQQQLAQRAVQKLEDILANRTKNKSFDYFLKKIGVE